MTEPYCEDPLPCTIGALIIRIEFWGPLDLVFILKNPQNSIGNY